MCVCVFFFQSVSCLFSFFLRAKECFYCLNIAGGQPNLYTWNYWEEDRQRKPAHAKCSLCGAHAVCSVQGWQSSWPGEGGEELGFEGRLTRWHLFSCKWQETQQQPGMIPPVVGSVGSGQILALAQWLELVWVETLLLLWLEVAAQF